VQVSTANASICPGDSIQICATGGFVNYNWINGETTRCIEAKLSGDYYVVATDSNHCFATSDTEHISIYTALQVSVGLSGDTLKGYNSQSYQWLLNGAPIPGATSQLYVARTPGQYELEVTDSNGCLEVSTPVVISGINDLDEKYISVYPNPSNGNWQLSVSNEFINSAIEVYNPTGQLVFKYFITHQISDIGIPNLANGVYELRVIAQQGIFVKKLVKM
jgi:hypothetical protein